MKLQRREFLHLAAGRAPPALARAQTCPASPSRLRDNVADVYFGKVGAVAARSVPRFARNSRDWQQLIKMCRFDRSGDSALQLSSAP